jgi:predicted MFS family arabinose efflux permease
VTANNRGFAVVTAGYFATTTAESLLAPAFPLLAKDLGLGTGLAGVAFAILAAAIAAGGVGGGLVLARRGPRAGIGLGLLLVAAGSAATAATGGPATFLPAQVVLGMGSGVFFASGLRSAAVLAGERRRGLAIGIFGVAFSGGLALAGGLAALGAIWGWRTSYVAAAALAALTGAAGLLVRLPATPAGARRRSEPIRLRTALAAPLHVGGVAAASQYGTVAFLPLFAVRAWGLSPATAALVLTAARIASVPAKLVSGNASDGAGAMRIGRRLGLLLGFLGAWWTIAPGPAAAAWAAVLFAAFVSGLGPVANVLALESFEEHAELLGVFRSAQIGLGAAASGLLGVGAAIFGLRAVLAVAAIAIPASLVVPLRRASSAGLENAVADSEPSEQRGHAGVDRLLEG